MDFVYISEVQCSRSPLAEISLQKSLSWDKQAQDQKLPA